MSFRWYEGLERMLRDKLIYAEESIEGPVSIVR